MAKLGQFFFRYRNVLGPAVFLLALALSAPEYPLGRADLKVAIAIAGFALALMGQLLRILTIGYQYIVRGGRNRQVYADDLVQGGFFSLCRNPLYFGNLLIIIGLALVIHAIAFYIIVIPLAVFAYGAIVAAEEAYLSKKFGKDYAHYCRRVNRWWPRFTRARSSVSALRFNWKRVLLKEYNTTFVIFGVLAGLYLWSQYCVQGASALPSPGTLSGGALTWTILYLAVRTLKKGGFLRE